MNIQEFDTLMGLPTPPARPAIHADDPRHPAKRKQERARRTFIPVEGDTGHWTVAGRPGWEILREGSNIQVIGPLIGTERSRQAAAWRILRLFEWYQEAQP